MNTTKTFTRTAALIILLAAVSAAAQAAPKVVAPGDRTPAVADGYFLFLKPLKRGRHSLELRMTNADQSVTGVNYRLIVP